MSLFIGEIKTRTPFKTYSGLAWMELLEIAKNNCDWISIHTDYRWAGSFKFLAWVCKNVKKPILAKGFHQSEAEIANALTCGASHVLTVDYIPKSQELASRCIFECTHSQQFSETLLAYPHGKFLCNRRNPNSGEIKSLADYDVEYTTYRKHCDWLCQASMIATEDDVFRSADAILVGENLEKFVQHRIMRQLDFLDKV